MRNLIDMVKNSGGYLLVIVVTGWILFLVILQMLGSLAPKPPTAPEPPVIGPSEPRSPQSGCSIVEGIEICPKANAGALQNSNASHSDQGSYCTYHQTKGKNKFGEVRSKATPEAIKTVELAARVLQSNTTFKVYSATFESSPIAYVRYLISGPEIVYDRDIFPSTKGRKRVSWTLIKVAGHEVAHHRLGHTINKNGDSWSREASSDYLAGMAVYRIGGSLSNALEITDMYSSGSRSHPSKTYRAAALTAGWMQARERHYDPSNTCYERIISPSFDRFGQTCKMVVSCESEKEPIKFACIGDGNKWEWQ